jgi:hypothetical protein
MSQAESSAPITGPHSEGTTPRIETPDVPFAREDIDGLHPPLVAVGDVLIGGLLFLQFASLFGLVVAAVGVAVLCTLACRALGSGGTGTDSGRLR